MQINIYQKYLHFIYSVDEFWNMNVFELSACIKYCAQLELSNIYFLYSEFLQNKILSNIYLWWQYMNAVKYIILLR